MSPTRPGAGIWSHNHVGIRVKAYRYDQPSGGGAKSSEQTVVYLTDAYNHTGYAQTLEERTYDGTDTSGTPVSLTTYLIGDDVIAQARDGNTEYLLYGGHGSTRQLVAWTGTAVSIADTFSYDGYGVLLQDQDNFPPTGSQLPGRTASQATNLLYAGEYFDSDSQQYYNRARWYSPLIGRFNRLDPYPGNMQDPQSLHKYLYAHGNPANGTDPSGMFFGFGGVTSVLITVAILVVVVVIAHFLIRGFWHSKRRDYGVYQGPDITDDLFKYMRAVARHAHDQLGAEPSSAGLGYMLRHGGNFVMRPLKTKPPAEPGELQSVLIAERCVSSDVPGNIMLGFVGRVAHVRLATLLTASFGGDFGQKVIKQGHFRADEPEDRAAISFGYELADQYIGSDGVRFGEMPGRLNKESFRSAFLDSPHLSVMTSPVADLPPHKPRFRVTESPFDLRPYK